MGTIKQGQKTTLPTTQGFGIPPPFGLGYVNIPPDGSLGWRVERTGVAPINLPADTEGESNETSHGWTVDSTNYPASVDITCPADATLTSAGTQAYQVTVIRNPPGFVACYGATFDVVQGCQPATDLDANLHGNVVTLTWENPTGHSDVYRAYYDANGDFIRRELAATGVTDGQFSETVTIQVFDGFGNHPVLTYQIESDCSGDKSTPIQVPPGDNFPITYDWVKAHSLKPITALRHYRLRR